MQNMLINHSLGNRRSKMPNLVPDGAAPDYDGVENGFIRHPERFPLRYRRTPTWNAWWRKEREPGNANLGVSFHSRKYIPAGTEIELSIPLRGEVQKFVGTVVLVREQSGGFEIGLWLATADDATRARIVEQICHIECYLEDRQSSGRLPSINHAASEWISRFAHQIPD